jgi:hypothetical protein
MSESIEIEKEIEIKEEKIEDNSIVARAERANKALDEKIKHYESLKEEVDNARAEQLLSGTSNAGQEVVEKKEEMSNKDYAEKALEGDYNGKEKTE